MVVVADQETGRQEWYNERRHFKERRSKVQEPRPHMKRFSVIPGEASVAKARGLKKVPPPETKEFKYPQVLDIRMLSTILGIFEHPCWNISVDCVVAP